MPSDLDRYMKTRKNGCNASLIRDVPFTCAICGKKCMTTRAAADRAKYCSPECRQAGQREKRREDNENGQRRGVGKIGGPWHIVCDPDDSWGMNSTLTWHEVYDLLRMGYLAIGLMVRHEKLESCYRVERGQRGLRMERVE
jgi:hypothetical protein